MTDATTTQGSSASSMLGGDSAPPGAVQGQGQTQTQTQQQAQQTQTTQGNGSAIEWVKDWPAADAGIVEKKGYRTPADLFKAYRELESKLGQDKIVLPKDGADSKEWDAVYGKLGRPDSADKYVMPQGSDEAMFKAIAPGLHGAGLTQKQLDAATSAYNQYVQNITAQMQVDLKADFKTAEDALSREWGVNAPKELEIERRAMRAFGIDVATIERMAQGGGKGGALMLHRLLNAAGRAITEDQGANIASDESLGFAGTPNRAAADLQELKSNKDFMERMRRGDPAARAKYNNLLKQVSEGGRVKKTINTPY